MKEGPDIARIGALIGDPARADILTALMNGQALTASELALESGVTPQTASSHLAKLEVGGLIRQIKQGRHRYYSLAGQDAGDFLETKMGFATKTGHVRLRPGPKDPALRKARVCYNHLAGDMGVSMLESLCRHNYITSTDQELQITPEGAYFFDKFGVDLNALKPRRRPLCKACLDWSARRHHLAGALGTALLNEIIARGWAKRQADSRVILFSKSGEVAFLSGLAS